MTSYEVRGDRRYTNDHEWAKADGDRITVGITAYAVDQLGDITMVNIDVGPGDDIEAGKAFGTVESVKTLADLYAPVGGKIAGVNDSLQEQPELVNDDCYEGAWMIALVPSDPAALDGLLAAEAYTALLDEQAG